MSGLAAAVEAALRDLDCRCYAFDAMEYLDNYPCPRCRLRQALRDEAKEVRGGSGDRGTGAAA